MNKEIKEWIEGLAGEALHVLKSRKFWLNLLKKLFGWLMTTNAYKSLVKKIEALDNEIRQRLADINLAKVQNTKKKK